MPFLGQIPLVQGIREGGDVGIPAMMGDEPVARKAFIDFAGATVRSIAMRNAHIDAARVASLVNA